MNLCIYFCFYYILNYILIYYQLCVYHGNNVIILWVNSHKLVWKKTKSHRVSDTQIFHLLNCLIVFLWSGSAGPLSLCRPKHKDQGQWLGDKARLYASKVERQWPWKLGCAQAGSPKEHYIDQSHRLRTRRHRTAPGNQTGSRQRAARPTRSAGHAEYDGTCPKRKKRTQGG